jgi:hypothetical protein
MVRIGLHATNFTFSARQRCLQYKLMVYENNCEINSKLGPEQQVNAVSGT